MTATYAVPLLSFDQQPEPLYRFQREYARVEKERCPNSNFIKGVQWSPDGTCFLTASEDTGLRVYDLAPEALQQQAELNTGDGGETGSATCAEDSYAAVLRIDEGETIYDYAWYPGMVASDPATCCCASTARGKPLHLWDVCTGELRCSYRGYNAVDEVTPAYSVAFSLDGGRLWAGYNKSICIFDVARPGRDCRTLTTHQRRQEGLPGIVSCFSFSPDRSGLVAVGAYSGAVGLYDETSLQLTLLLQGHKGGITQVQFSSDGNYLYTGARRDDEIWCWDVRYSMDAVYRLQRASGTTNQRIGFDIEPIGRHLATGGEDGKVRVFDLQTGQQCSEFVAADDTVNGFAFHPMLPLGATASGHRRYPQAADGTADGDEALPAAAALEAPELSRHENILRVWRFQHTWSVFDAAGPVEAAVQLAEGTPGDGAGAAAEAGIADSVQVVNSVRELTLAGDGAEAAALASCVAADRVVISRSGVELEQAPELPGPEPMEA